MAIDRRKRPLVRERGDWRDASLFIIATEGEKTEPRYFDLFRSARVKVKMLPCEDGASSPEGVLKRIAEFKKAYHFGKGDSFWLVIDKDRWTIKAITAVFSECRRKKFTMVISNPQFEIWLSLHFEAELPNPITKMSLVKHLKAEMGSYSKHNFPADGLLEKCEDASRRAKALDVGPHAIWPDCPGSRVYSLVDSLLAKLDK